MISRPRSRAGAQAPARASTPTRPAACRLPAAALWLLLAILAACTRPQAEPLQTGAPASAPIAAAAAPGHPAQPPLQSTPKPPAGWPFTMDAAPAAGKSGVVTTDAALATKVGVEVLQRGGNAVDAAVATALALAVVYPLAGNIGGGGFLVLRAADGKTASLDFRETAPRKATRTMYQGSPSPSEASLVGHLAAGVPGTVAGLWEAHRRHGSLAWADLCAPAIKLADSGFEVTADFADSIRDESARLGRFPASAALYLPSGNPPKVGSTFRNPDLGRVLRRIAEKGDRGFYEGETADLLVAEMQRGGGIITRDDLKEYRPRWREPVVVDYRGHRVISMPPPSSGGLVLALALKALEGDDLGRMGWSSADAIHLEAEVLRRAFALRNHYLGDPDVVPVPTDQFLSPQAAARLRASIAMDRATPSAEVTPGFGAGHQSTHTTHFSVADGKGGAVALTTTINTRYGSGVTVTGAGFLLNNEMDDFATEPGKPNGFGLVQGEANAIAPGKRMLSSMTPTIVLDPQGRVQLVTGAAGGPTIITAVMHVVSNVIDHGMAITAAVAAPRFHHQHLPDLILVEDNGLDLETRKALEARGHKVSARPRIADAPSLLFRDGMWTGSSEPRNPGGFALGY